MAIHERDVATVQEEPAEYGGVTYWIESNKWLGSQRALCYRPMSSNYNEPGTKCARPAGYGTKHFGTGACKFHGGNNYMTAMVSATKTGNVSKAVKASMRDRIDVFMEKDSKDLLNLTFELATLRVLFQDMLDNMPDEDDRLDYALHTQRMSTMVVAIGALVDKISRIESRGAITAAQIVYLRVKLTDILVKWIPDPERRVLALQELASAIPGGHKQQQEADVVVQT